MFFPNGLLQLYNTHRYILRISNGIRVWVSLPLGLKSPHRERASASTVAGIFDAAICLVEIRGRVGLSRVELELFVESREGGEKSKF